MEFLIKVLQFFLSFTILVGIHEFGHFITARMFKIRVDKFYIFFDPWFSLFKIRRGQTEYGLGWLPLGGYCKIGGMIDESMDKEQMEGPVRPDDFRAKPAWQRLCVMLAGVTMNVLLAITIYCGVCYTWGDSYLSNEDARWGYNFNETGLSLGFRNGDRILEIDSQKIDNITEILPLLLITESDRRVTVLRDGQPRELLLPMDKLIRMRREKSYEQLFTLRMPYIVDSTFLPSAAALSRGDEIVGIDTLKNAEYPQYREYIRTHAGQELIFDVIHPDRSRELIPITVPAEGQVGIMALTSPYTPRTRTYTFLESIPAGFRRAGHVAAEYWEQLKLIVQPKTRMYEEVGGFIAIGNIFSSEWNWYDFWMKTAFLSILLAVMNLLPIPGLDGGHAMFTTWELITRRKVNERVLEVAQYIGLMLLLMLLLYANGNDIYRIFLK